MQVSNSFPDGIDGLDNYDDDLPDGVPSYKEFVEMCNSSEQNLFAENEVQRQIAAEKEAMAASFVDSESSSGESDSDDDEDEKQRRAEKKARREAKAASNPTYAAALEAKRGLRQAAKKANKAGKKAGKGIKKAFGKKKK